MPESEYNYPFSRPELAALESLRDSVARGVRSEHVPGYRPASASLFTQIRLFQSFPDLAAIPVTEEPFEPKERIGELVRTLDAKIMNNPKKKKRGGTDAYEVTGTKTAEGTYINFRRYKSLKDVSIVVANILGSKDVYPYIETEEFFLSSDGTFTLSYFERYSPYEGCRKNTIAAFNLVNPEMDKNTANKLRYFSNLIKPFLSP